MPEVQGGSFYNYNHQTMVDFEDSGVVQLTFPQDTTGLPTYSTAVYGTNCEMCIRDRSHTAPPRETHIADALKTKRAR